MAIKRKNLFLFVSMALAVLAAAGVFFWQKTDGEISLPTPEFAAFNDFSIDYPKGFKTTTYEPEEGIKIITFENSSSGAEEAFQIFIMPFDEPGPLTKERIWLDLDVEIENAENISVGGVQALSFKGRDESLGETFEVWLIHSGKVYQVTAPFTFKDSLKEILKTWKFQ